MTKIALRLSLLAGALAATAVACGSGGPDEAEVLASITDDVMVPSYEAMAAETASLSDALDALCAAPSDAALNDAQGAWRDAREAWARSAASGLGPVLDRRSTGVIAWAIVQPERIDTLLASDSVITADFVRNNISSTQRGLGGIEYVLFGDSALSSLAGDPARCAYLTAAASVIADEAAALRQDWTTGDGDGPPYKDYFTGRADEPLETSEAVAEVVRTQVFLIRTIVDMRLAGALGLRGEADPTAIPGGAGLNALADLRNEVQGMRDVYEGVEGGLGISDLIVPLSEEADERVRGGFEASLAAIDAVDGPLREAAATNSAQAVAVYEALMGLQDTISTEVVSLLGVSVGFSDADGDSLR